MSTKENDALKLSPPGQGLPWWQLAVSKHLLLPVFFKTNPWQKALDTFTGEGKFILAIARKLTSAESTTRVLVAPMWGIEDSSRYWSAAMVMEHLIITGDKMAEAIVTLSQGHEPAGEKISTADVKPRGELSAGKAIKDYADFLERFQRSLADDVADRASACRYEHPWFGPLTPHQWLCVAALHQRIHRLQAQAIVNGLPKTQD